MVKSQYGSIYQSTTYSRVVFVGFIGREFRGIQQQKPYMFNRSNILWTRFIFRAHSVKQL